MLKSIILLFLLGTIVTLLPFVNSMNNLNTMAIQEENYKSYQTNDILKKIDCDNINTNLNGLNFNSN